MPAKDYINQNQLRNLFAGDFHMEGEPKEYQLRVGDLHPEGIREYSWDAEHYDDLKKSIQDRGITNPLLVRGNTLIDGHHRAVIARELELAKIPIKRIGGKRGR